MSPSEARVNNVSSLVDHSHRSARGGYSNGLGLRRPLPFDSEGSRLPRLATWFAYAIDQWIRYPSVDHFGNIVIDIAAIGVRPIVEFDHLLAFFLGMGFHRSQRGRHDLDSGRTHQIES